VPYAISRDSVPHAHRVGVCVHRGSEPSDHVLDFVRRASLHLHEHQYRDVPEQVAGGQHSPRLHASVPSGAGGAALHAVRDHANRDLPRLRFAVERDGHLLCHRVDLVPLLPLQVRAARRSVHDAVAEATRLLMGRRDPQRFFARAVAILEDSELQATGSVGYPRLVGRYRELPVQVHPVIDTLPMRRLPALWLLVTVQSALPISARFDLRMRPNVATTFSNFDLLPATMQLPDGFPRGAVLRTDDPERILPAHIVAPHLDVFEDMRA